MNKDPEKYFGLRQAVLNSMVDQKVLLALAEKNYILRKYSYSKYYIKKGYLTKSDTIKKDTFIDSTQ